VIVKLSTTRSVIFRAIFRVTVRVRRSTAITGLAVTPAIVAIAELLADVSFDTVRLSIVC